MAFSLICASSERKRGDEPVPTPAIAPVLLLALVLPQHAKRVTGLLASRLRLLPGAQLLHRVRRVLVEDRLRGIAALDRQQLRAPHRVAVAPEEPAGGGLAGCETAIRAGPGVGRVGVRLGAVAAAVLLARLADHL